MKKYLSNTMLALLISVTTCFGQNWNYTPPDTVNKHYDTVKCIMLVCDTAHFYMDEFIADSIQHRDTSNLYFGVTGKWVKKDYGYAGHHLPFWQIGYEVVVKTFDQVPDDAASVHHNTDGSWTDDAVIHWRITEQNEHIEYLDADKKPLNKNIIVWQSKSL